MAEFKDNPLVSIITVTYNAEAFLEGTIQSVLSQTYPHIEYLIIDGASTDGTIDIIKKYASHISYWVSEADQGIYDAMNKGMAIAQGQYIWFMNAGDYIYASDTLEKLMNAPHPSRADIYYGETHYIDMEGHNLGLRSEVTPMRLPKALSWKDIRKGLVVCHQAFIVKRKMAPNYDLEHPYSADIDWVIRCLKNAERVRNTQLILAIYRQGGYSRKFLMKSLSDRFKILQRHYGFLPNIWNHCMIVVRSLLYLIRHRKGY